MVPKAFPYPLGIGVDVCRVSRVAHLLQKQNLCNRWARKVFTRLEWSALWNHVKKAQLMAAADTWKGNGIDMTITPGEQTSCSRNDPPTDNSIWMLPELPERSLSRRSSIQSKVADNGADFDGRSPIELLARHLAGRWAAKEAVIKAHSNRRLYMREISIINPSLNPGMFPEGLAKKSKVIALVDPMVNTILMDARVAEIRSLRGFGPRSQGFPKGALLTRRDHNMSNSSDTLENGSERYLERRAKIEESHRQIAEINISHDGDTAVAVCMALDQPKPETKEKVIVDDGRFDPIHEPEWGDEGWFSRDSIADKYA